MSRVTLTEVRALIRQILHEELEGEESNTFLDHIRGWVEMVVDVLVSKGSLRISDPEIRSVMAAIDQDVENNVWLEHDLGDFASKRPGFVFVSNMFFNGIEKNDPIVKEYIERMSDNDEGGDYDVPEQLPPSEDDVTEFYLKKVLNQSEKDKLIDHLTSIMVKILPDIEEELGVLYNGYTADPTEVYRAAFNVIFNEMLEQSHRGNSLRKWALSTFGRYVVTIPDRIRRDMARELGISDEEYSSRYKYDRDLKIVLQSILAVIGVGYGDVTGLAHVWPEIQSYFIGLDDPFKPGSGSTPSDRNVDFRKLKLIDIPTSTRLIDTIVVNVELW